MEEDPGADDRRRARLQPQTIGDVRGWDNRLDREQPVTEPARRGRQVGGGIDDERLPIADVDPATLLRLTETIREAHSKLTQHLRAPT